MSTEAAAPVPEQAPAVAEPAATEAAPAPAHDTITAQECSVVEDQLKETPIFEIFSREVRIPGLSHDVHGEDDEDSHRKFPHILNTSRTRHTLQLADEPQLTGVLPVSKSLQKALKTEQDRWKKASDRAKKLEKRENESRDEDIKKIEKRLEKELKELKHVLDVENKKLPAEERQTPEEVEDMAKKLKWRTWKEYDRVLVQAHLDNMTAIYRLRMLDMLPCYENLQVAEWEELTALEEQEFQSLEKKHGIEIKRLNSNLKWGRFVAKVKGTKSMDDGQVVKKAEFDEYAQVRTQTTEQTHTMELEQLKIMQAERRNKLREAQKEVMDTVIKCQDQLIDDIQLDNMTGIVGARRATATSASQEPGAMASVLAPGPAEPTPDPAEPAPTSPEPTPAPAEPAPISPEPTPAPAEPASESPEPTPAPAEPAPASPEPTLAPAELAFASPEQAPAPAEPAPAASPESTPASSPATEANPIPAKEIPDTSDT